MVGSAGGSEIAGGNAEAQPFGGHKPTALEFNLPEFNIDFPCGSMSVRHRKMHIKLEGNMRFSKQGIILASASAMVMTFAPINAVAQEEPTGACIKNVLGKKICNIATRSWCATYQNLHITTLFLEGYSCEEAKNNGYY